MADDKTAPERAAEVYHEDYYDTREAENIARRAFVAGAAWQAEQTADRVTVAPDRETVAELLFHQARRRALASLSLTETDTPHVIWENTDQASWLVDAAELLAAGVLGVPADRGLHFECNCVPEIGPTHCHGCSEVAGGPVEWADRMCRPADQRTADRETIARTLAMTDDENGCFERVDAWEALPEWEKEAHPGEEPFSDREDCAYWLRRADAVLAVLVPADPEGGRRMTAGQALSSLEIER